VVPQGLQTRRSSGKVYFFYKKAGKIYLEIGNSYLGIEKAYFKTGSAYFLIHFSYKQTVAEHKKKSPS
jgi:hypothetical protein